jgi:hypothetical protein
VLRDSELEVRVDDDDSYLGGNDVSPYFENSDLAVAGMDDGRLQQRRTDRSRTAWRAG